MRSFYLARFSPTNFNLWSCSNLSTWVVWVFIALTVSQNYPSFSNVHSRTGSFFFNSLCCVRYFFYNAHISKYFDILLPVQSTLHYHIRNLIAFLKISQNECCFYFSKKNNVQCYSKFIYLLQRLILLSTNKRLNNDENFTTVFISPARFEIRRGGIFHKHNTVGFWLSTLL